MSEVRPPDLRIIPVESILPHEEFDVQRAKPLLEKIALADVWLHPPIVTPLPESDSRYVLLDGTNRCFSLRELGFPHILVQVVSYATGQVILSTWNHVVAGITLSDFLPAIEQIPHIYVQPTDLLTAQAMLAQRDALAYLIDFTTHQVVLLQLDDHSPQVRSATLRALVDTYKNTGILNRLNTADVEVVQQSFPDGTTLIVFPHYEPAEILTAARDHHFLPPGISRHVVQGRALRLHYPIQMLRDSTLSLEDKNAHLQEWVADRNRERAVRFYAESTFIFDE